MANNLICDSDNVRLDVYVAEHAKSLSSKKPLGVGPIIGYLSQKEAEIKNLKIIARAKREADFPNSKIMEMLIWVQSLL